LEICFLGAMMAQDHVTISAKLVEQIVLRRRLLACFGSCYLFPFARVLFRGDYERIRKAGLPRETYVMCVSFTIMMLINVFFFPFAATGSQRGELRVTALLQPGL
jgi:hypothetical protein